MATVDDAIKAIGEQVGAGDFALRNRLYVRELGQEPSVSVYQSGITVNSFAETTYSIEVRYHVPPSQRRRRTRTTVWCRRPSPTCCCGCRV